VLLTLLINAPSIRPLITWLGLDRMSEEESAELRRGLLEAQQQAHAVIERLATTTGLPPTRVDSIRTQIDGVFEHDVPGVDPSRHLRHTYLEALRMEMEELESLYKLGVIQEYTYLDLRNRISRDRMKRTHIHGDMPLRDTADGYGSFARFEQLALRWLRERNAFAGLLARLQRARLSQVIQRDIAAILCAEAVIEALPERVGLTPHDTAAVVALYRDRVQRKRSRLQHLRRDFPEFYADLENRLTRSAALTRARQYAVGSHHSGDIGAKAFGRIDRRLAGALASLPDRSDDESGPTAAALIARVPLFKGLSDRALGKLAAQAQTVTFLPGDIVIGEGEKGSALYILMRGSVEVVRGIDDAATRVALLGQGDIFGERALLHDEIRSATVRAVSALTLLRLTRASVRALADEHEEIAARLERADQARR
jgi:CPA1 family monovalent cation:H+ antiporter